MFGTSTCYFCALPVHDEACPTIELAKGDVDRFEQLVDIHVDGELAADLDQPLADSHPTRALGYRIASARRKREIGF